MTGRELKYIKQAYADGHLSGNGQFTKKCQAWLEKEIGCHKALLTHSCTAALEMAAILANIQPGDEIIMLSYTFVSTANAFVLRGGVPVFVDIRLDTLNIDETKIEAAITPRTKAIVPIHYAGVACEMDKIMEIAKKHKLLVIEDVAHGIMSQYKRRHLGKYGHMAAISFHETKNIISGEGGALFINDPRFSNRAEIIREKGTNRYNFFRGKVDKYTWVDIGSSYLPNELTAAFLWAQMQKAKTIIKRRLRIWNDYHTSFAVLEKKGYIRRPIIAAGCTHNGHIYYLLLQNLRQRDLFISKLKKIGINAIFHYAPLDDSLAGKKYARKYGELKVTHEMCNRIVRLPLWIGMTKKQIEYVKKHIIALINEFH